MSIWRTARILMILPLLAGASAACTHAAPPEPAAAEPAGLVRTGQAIAETRCAGCHAIGRSGRSPHPDAKPFRQLSEVYPVSDLAESLAEGILVGHPDMPAFTFEEADIDALIAYLESIQAPHPA